MGLRIARDCDVIGLRSGKAFPCGENRQAGPVFDTDSAFFFF